MVRSCNNTAVGGTTASGISVHGDGLEILDLLSGNDSGDVKEGVHVE